MILLSKAVRDLATIKVNAFFPTSRLLQADFGIYSGGRKKRNRSLGFRSKSLLPLPPAPQPTLVLVVDLDVVKTEAHTNPHPSPPNCQLIQQETREACS